jgi:hypothetical protein
MVKIEQPRDVTVQTKNGTAVLKWAPGTGSRKTAAFNKSQKFIDSECLRHMDSMTPMRSGALIQSATLGTVIGDGHIVYNSPYARRQYYENTGGSPRHPGAKSKWFESMKAQFGETIRKGAAKYVSGSN